MYVLLHHSPADTSGSKEIWINGEVPLRFLIDMQKGSKCGKADFCIVSPWRNTPVRMRSV